MSYDVDSIIETIEQWPKEHLDAYIKKLEVQVSDIRKLLSGLKKVQAKKQREINRKLRESGARGAT